MVDVNRFYIDCEFDGHNGTLLSMAIVRDDGLSMYIKVANEAFDPWVLENVIPILDDERATFVETVEENAVGESLRALIGDCLNPIIVADSPVDIARFCRAISTASDGSWKSTNYERMTFEVHNVDCYPTKLVGAVQHNAWWDAKALQNKLQEILSEDV